MLYPRLDKENRLVADEQLVGVREHLASKHRVLHLSGPITRDNELAGVLLALDSLSTDPIKLIITSPGGDLDSAYLLYDTLKLLGSPVWTLGRYAASAAVPLLAVGQKRYLLPHAKVMLHLPATYFREIALEHVELEIYQREAKKYKDRLVEILVECGATKGEEEILGDIDHDFWLEPKEAIEYGLADEVMTKEVLGAWLR